MMSFDHRMTHSAMEQALVPALAEAVHLVRLPLKHAVCFFH